MSAKKHFIYMVLLLLIGVSTTSCDSNTLKIEKYFKDYTYDTSLSELKAKTKRFEPISEGYKVMGKVKYLGFPSENVTVLANPESGDFKGLKLKTVPNVPLEKLIKSMKKEYGSEIWYRNELMIWNKGDHYILLDTTESGNGYNISIIHHKSAFEPFQDLEWQTERSVIEQRIGKPNRAKGEDADTKYIVQGEYDGHEAIIAYLFENNRLVAVDCNLIGQVENDLIGTDNSIAPQVLREVYEDLVEKYGEEDIKRYHRGGQFTGWDFGTSIIMYQRFKGAYLDSNSLSVHFEQISTAQNPEGGE
ncbi:hypothetical protein QYZ87_02925 [Porphyromonadaceae bacterium W3.11]|nr:hypothetical protein [Porphyromonadaceae bacterium W3.11]